MLVVLVVGVGFYTLTSLVLLLDWRYDVVILVGHSEQRVCPLAATLRVADTARPAIARGRNRWYARLADSAGTIRGSVVANGAQGRGAKRGGSRRRGLLFHACRGRRTNQPRSIRFLLLSSLFRQASLALLFRAFTLLQTTTDEILSTVDHLELVVFVVVNILVLPGLWQTCTGARARNRSRRRRQPRCQAGSLAAAVATRARVRRIGRWRLGTEARRVGSCCCPRARGAYLTETTSLWSPREVALRPGCSMLLFCFTRGVRRADRRRALTWNGQSRGHAGRESRRARGDWCRGRHGCRRLRVARYPLQCERASVTVRTNSALGARGRPRPSDVWCTVPAEV